MIKWHTGEVLGMYFNISVPFLDLGDKYISVHFIIKHWDRCLLWAPFYICILLEKKF